MNENITHNGSVAQVKAPRVPREQKPYFLTGRNKRKTWFLSVLPSANFFFA